MNSVNYDTINRIIKLNDVITKHLAQEENCKHSIRQIVSEAFDLEINPSRKDELFMQNEYSVVDAEQASVNDEKHTNKAKTS